LIVGPIWTLLALAPACRPSPTVEGDRLLATTTGEAPRNLLVVSLDTLRKDLFARYGGTGELDFLDALMDQSVSLDRHRSCSNWTLSSFTCAWSGNLDLDLGFHVWSRDEDVPNLPVELDLLPDWLERRGFATALVSASQVLGGTDGITANFQPLSLSHDARMDWVVDEGLAVLDDLEANGDPWMLQLHGFDTHSPYSPHQDYRTELDALEALPWDLDNLGGMGGLTDAWPELDDDVRELVLAHLDVRYRGEAAFADDQLARLWEALDARGTLDDTLVWVWTDHGEQFYEHNNVTHDRSVQREEVDAVSFFWARTLAEPRAWTRPTSHADLAPTVTDALGQPVEDGLRGRILTSDLEDAPAHTFRYSADDPVQHAVELGDHRLVYKWDGTARVYDVLADPRELDPSWDPSDPVHQALWDALQPMIDDAETLMPHLERTDPPD
jgi:arylsulfatase A-like enzyme